MRKNVLLQISPKEPTAAMMEEARNDRYLERTRTQRYSWQTYDYKFHSYATRLYITAKREDDNLVIAVYLRGELAAGRITPAFVTYNDVKAEKWLSYRGGKWSEAYTDRIVSDMRDVIRKTDWMFAHDVQDQEDIDLCNSIFGTKKESVLEALDEWQCCIRGKQNELRAEKRVKHWAEQMAKIPPVPENFMDWAEGEGTVGSNFLFYKRKGKKTKVFCTHCGATYETDAKMVHNPGDPRTYSYDPKEKDACKNCHHIIATKAWGKQKELHTEDRVILMQRAEEYVAFRSFRVKKRFVRKSALPKQETWEKHTYITENARVLTNAGTFISHESYIRREIPSLGRTEWAVSTEGGYYGYDRSAWQIGSGILYQENVSGELEGTGVHPIVAHLFLDGREKDPQYALINAARKGYIEYMLKAGLKRLAIEAAAMHYTNNVMNEDAKNLKDLLGIDGQQLSTLKRVDGNSYTVAALKYIKEHREKLDDDTLIFIAREKIRPGDLAMKITGMTMQRMINYIRRQSKQTGASFAQANRTYGDYLTLARARGMDLKDEIVCHTPRMQELHDRYVEEKNAAEDAKERKRVNKVFANIAKTFKRNKEHFSYEKEGLVIVVPRDAYDIKVEGKKQHHCVGASDTYMKRMSQGETFILFLRRKEKPREPYYTLEVEYDGKIRQSYGAYDRKPDWEKIEPVLTGFTRKIAQRTKKEQLAMSPAV